MFIILKPFHERRDPALTGDAIAAELRERAAARGPGGPRAASSGRRRCAGLGNAGGFKLMVEATGDVNFDALQAQADNLAAKGNQQPGLVGLFNGFRARTPQLYVDIDRTKVKTMGVALTDVFDTLQVYLGGYYVNDFNRFGRTWQVNVQADAPFRMDAETVKQLKVRNADGDMVPLGAVADVRDIRRAGDDHALQHVPGGGDHRRLRCPASAPATSCATMESLADQELPRTMTSEWTELSYLQKQAEQGRAVPRPAAEPVQRVRAGGGAGLLRAGRPVRELVAAAGGDPGRADVPAVRARPASRWRGMDVNIFVQVGFVVLVGLACKNAILIVEFARDRQQEGASPVRRRRGGRPGAAAADPDDVVRVHPRRVAAGDRRRGRRRDAPHAGHGGASPACSA